MCDLIRVDRRVLFSVSTLFLLMLELFRALDEAKKLLKKAGFVQVSERDNWNLEAGKRYFFTRNYSTIVAFAIGKKYVWFHKFRCSLNIIGPLCLLFDINSGYSWLPENLAKEKDTTF